MCGFLGILLSPPGHVSGAAIERALGRLAHRGPDDQGWLALGDEGIATGRAAPPGVRAAAVLVHRRLSILDLSPAGRQPMSSPDGRFHLVHNGEIYNYLELRRELERLGHRFGTHTDTEVILAAYHEWGKGALDHLVGMFAFAILDAAERRLLLARDFFGMKPLYYAHVEGGLAFASEIAPLLDLGSGRAVNPQGLFDYLRFGRLDHGSETCFAGIRQLPAAHCVELDLDAPTEVRPVRYWAPRSDDRLDISFEGAAERLRDLFLGGLEQHLRSDVPVGAALSGGVESSSIVMGMRALRGDSLDLRTFSYIADTPAFNEERWIDVVVGASKASPWKIGLTPQDFMADFDRLLEAQGEPIQEPAAYPQHRVFGLARGGGVKVILTGEGGDELFGGYTIFLTARLASLVRRGRVLAAARLVEQARRLGRVDRARDVVLDEGLILPRAVRELIRPVASEPLVPSWLDGRWFAERGVIAEPPPQPEGRDALHEKLHLYLTQEKLPRLLRYGDRNSMAFSLECRLPFLTPQLARFVSALPEEYLIAPDGTSKAVFRRAMRGIVPDEILDRRDKVGFQMPIPSWLPTLGPWLADLLDGADPAHVAPLRLDEVRSRWQPGAGAPALSDVYLLWRCANVVRWADRFAVSFEAS